MLVSLREFYGEPQRGIVIANGVDGGSGPGACRKEPFVLAAGRLWDQAKNLATLARAARRVRWPVYVAGSEEHPTGGDGTRQALNGLRTLGWLDLDELHRWMQRAAIYALPARYEPFGLSVLEAALRGCALVLGDIPSLREVWGDAAVYVPPDDADRLVDRLEQLAGDDSMRARMAQAAYDRACFFSAERMGRDYIRLYRELVVRRLPGASASTIWPRSSGDAGGSVESCK
jgi:glycosyltransferase involved in cell wall biosynthesis